MAISKLKEKSVVEILERSIDRVHEIRRTTGLSLFGASDLHLYERVVDGLEKSDTVEDLKAVLTTWITEQRPRG